MAEDRKPGFVHKLVLSQEKSRLVDMIELSQSNYQILRRGFLSGVASGFGVVVGATLIASLVLSLLGMLGHWVPGKSGKIIRGVTETALEKTGAK